MMSRDAINFMIIRKINCLCYLVVGKYINYGRHPLRHPYRKGAEFIKAPSITSR